MIGLGLRLDLTSARAGGVPGSQFAIIVVEGDSITGAVPGVDDNLYASEWKATVTGGKTVYIRAANSRALGAAPPDGGNNLVAKQAEDLAYSPNLYTVLIGANDLDGSADAATYFNKLKAHTDVIRASGCKVAVSAPFKYDDRGPSYASFNAKQIAYAAYLRANYASLAEYYIPIGEIPEFDGTQNGYISDGVHPTGPGDELVRQTFAAAANAIIYGTTGTGPTAGAWLGADATEQARSSVYECRYVVTGLTAGTTAAISISGASATYSIGSGAFGSSAGTVMNGDVVRTRVTTSASFSTAVQFTLTIGTGSDTFSVTTAATDPATTVLTETVGVNRNTYIDISGTPKLNFHGTDTIGAPSSARATQAPVAGKFGYAVTLTTLDARIIIGVDSNATAVGPSTWPSVATLSNNGMFVEILGNGAGNIWSGGVDTSNLAAATFAAGDLIILECDPGTGSDGTFKVYRKRSGTKTQMGATVTGLSSAKYARAIVGAEDTPDVAVANFGQTAIDLNSGYSAYG